MQPPSEGQFSYDAEPTSYAIAPNSPASDRSDVLSDRLLLEIELAHEKEPGVSAGSEEETYAKGEATISYEEALERELEFQKRMNVPILQDPIGSGSLSTHSQLSHVGIKRKLISGAQMVDVQKLPPKQFHGCAVRPQWLQLGQPPILQLQENMPSPQQSKHRHAFAQGQQYRQPLPHLSVNQQPLLCNPQGQQSPFLCHICRVICGNSVELKYHREGYKHKSKLQEICGIRKMTTSNESKIIWCEVCNISCPGEISYGQHLAGKKHAAQFEALQARNGAPGASVYM